MLLIYTEIREKNHQALLRLATDIFPDNYTRQLLRFRRWQDAQLSLLGKLLLKNGMALYNIDFDFHNILYSPHNKPYFANVEYNFNISHSGEIVVCAISTKKEEKIGIDIEKIIPVDITDFNVQMTDNEIKAVVLNKEPLYAFFRYWTSKESVIKAHGDGLSIPLKSFEINDNCTNIGNIWFYTNEIELKTGYICHLASTQKINAKNIKKIYIEPDAFL